MKPILLIFPLFISSIGFACPDFTGNYKDSGKYHYRLEQTACDKLVFVSWTSAMDIKAWSYVADNIFRFYGLIETATDLSEFHFTKDTLEQTSVFTYLNNGNLAMYSLKVTYSMDTRRNIIIRTIVYNGLGDVVDDSKVKLQPE